jgi:tRNA (guanosine-2'-O-)-methyltransferase
MGLSDSIEYLSQFTTEKRKELFQSIIEQRTKYITVVLEDIYQPHNASAVLRTCDCFGIQDVHIIENRNEYNINPDVCLGSDKWLNLKKYNTKPNNTTDALLKLKNNGYRIIATTPHHNDVSLDEFDITKGKIALIFGTELKGLSQQAMDLADGYLKIPMVGFTESFNISVSAAIILHFLTHKLRSQKKFNWELTDLEKKETLMEWLKVSVKDSDRILSNYISKKNKPNKS